MAKISFALPKGHLFDGAIKLLEQAGYAISDAEKSYRPMINDPRIELKILRPQEIPMFVSDGLHDIGITGLDWIKETRADVEVLLNLEYGAVKLVLAIPKLWADVNDLSGLLQKFHQENRVLRISTEYLNISAECIMSNPVYRELYGSKEPLIVTPWWRKGENSRVVLYLSFGATEAKPPKEADAIIDVMQTGETLERNNLKPIEVLMESSAILIANRSSLKDPEKREKIYDILMLLKGVIDGRRKLHIFVNVHKDNLPALLENLPALKRPTISPLADENWYSVNTVIDRDQFLEILPVLRKLTQGLVVYEPRQVLLIEEMMGDRMSRRDEDCRRQ